MQGEAPFVKLTKNKEYAMQSLKLELFRLQMIEAGRFSEAGGRWIVPEKNEISIRSPNGRPSVMLDMTHSYLLPLIVSREKEKDRLLAQGGTLVIMNDDYVLDLTNSPLLYELCRNNKRRKQKAPAEKTKRRKL